jgi:hypothetical protein
MRMHLRSAESHRDGWRNLEALDWQFRIRLASMASMASKALVFCCRHTRHVLLGLAGEVGHNAERSLDEH